MKKKKDNVAEPMIESLVDMEKKIKYLSRDVRTLKTSMKTTAKQTENWRLVNDARLEGLQTSLLHQILVQGGTARMAKVINAQMRSLLEGLEASGIVDQESVELGAAESLLSTDDDMITPADIAAAEKSISPKIDKKKTSTRTKKVGG